MQGRRRDGPAPSLRRLQAAAGLLAVLLGGAVAFVELQAARAAFQEFRPADAREDGPWSAPLERTGAQRETGDGL